MTTVMGCSMVSTMRHGSGSNQGATNDVMGSYTMVSRAMSSGTMMGRAVMTTVMD
ncbi:hypothetical protein KDH_34870 [Dictyobacter sp. S3.2.2.5]|uniref:Uncharacterized protein n=1 Tax=Dictyobacter halimunensis TaxID=3026934 RepID=A0ABQ6FVS7_9CHLR|nr:hypothetical protein KDH_34870 [Dictyobacter sp. S3.2.2.5]